MTGSVDCLKFLASIGGGLLDVGPITEVGEAEAEVEENEAEAEEAGAEAEEAEVKLKEKLKLSDVYPDMNALSNSAP